MVMREQERRDLSIETITAVLQADMDSSGCVIVDMGPACADWREIPLSGDVDTLHLPLEIDGLPHPVGVGMGNPHCVFIVEDAEAIDIERVGPAVERHTLFPDRTNVEFLSRLGDGRWRMRVWERGVGITQACGTGACAALVAAHRRGLTGRSAKVELDGGVLSIDWREDNHVLMAGPVATSFTGIWTD